MDKTVRFVDFWRAYGLKRDKVAAERAWNRLSARDRRAALAGIASYREACAAQGIAMMYAARYLGHRRWEDEDAPADVQAAPAASEPSGDLPSEMEIW